MKTTRVIRLVQKVSLTSGILLAVVSGSFAQTATSNSIPVVTVQATQPVATVSTPGVFTVFRAGNTDATLNVWYALGGTASNGVDYAMIPPHLVAIAAGATSNTIVITPATNLPSSLVKTVVLTLTNSPLLTPVNYQIGSPSQAVVFLENTNLPPPVAIATPKDGAVFYTPTNILIAANVSYFGYPVPTSIEFFAGTNDLGRGFFGISSGFGGTVSLTWSNPPPGGYALTAVASYDNSFPSATSAPVHITVLQGPVTNLPPVVSLVWPTNGAVFQAPANISLLARASDPDGVVTNVEFFAGNVDLGRGQPVVLDPPGVGGVVGLVYFLNWTNVPTGGYALTAVATDNGRLSTVSAPVNITVLGPGTNRPPVVQIASPPDNAVFHAPVSIPLYALATDPDGSVASVEFFAAGSSLGFGYRVTAVPPPWPTGSTPPTNAVPTNYWVLVWTNASVGTNIALTAKATDNGGAFTISAPVSITVLGPGTNRPPVVRITSPPNNAVFRAPVNIPLYAFATDPDDSVASVEFFAAGNSLGFGHPVTAVPPTLTPGPIQPPILIVVSNYWQLVWTNAPLGTNIALAARATDSGGVSTISAPVNISILPSPPPPTNRPALVSIVATDPVAIEGTNCWPWPVWNNWIAPTAVTRFITNCGPKNATFTVFRSGTTNNDLNISYCIGGTATNGIDYVTISTNVTILAGQLRAAITIVPLDDGPPDITSTVILKLVPGTNYLVGAPASAAVTILDSLSPRATTGLLPGNVFHVSAAGPDGAWFHVEYSTDMIHWTPVCTNQVINGGIDFVDPDAASQPARFYRPVPEAAPPQ